jgi:hypothetical protein
MRGLPARRRHVPEPAPIDQLPADLEAPDVVGPGPFGERQVCVGKGGKVAGERLSGALRPGGGDWLLVGADGYARLDVRGTIQTDDGALIYVSYLGVLELSERAMQALTQGPATEYGEVRFLTQPRFETGDPRYAWLNTAVCVAQGRLHPGPAVEYQVYEVDPGTD